MSTRSETELIELIKRLADDGDSPNLITGIGDDAAVLHAPPAGHELLATTDQVVENKHFVLSQHPPEALGHKLLARGLSDIAAMGGVPNWFLLSLAIPSRINNPWIRSFVEGLLAAREKFGVPSLPLAGGDVSGADSFLAHIAAVGAVPTGQALLRSKASVGDILYVSGELGGSALGLERLSLSPVTDPAVSNHLWPTPRLALGTFLREGGASAALDISDGLSTDLHRMASASGVAMHVDLEALPRFAEATESQVLHGGEEYELLFTAPATVVFHDQYDGVRLTRIGEAVSGRGVSLLRAGQTERLDSGGYEHLND
jgi:thiamine-monophosphate kinase